MRVFIGIPLSLKTKDQIGEILDYFKQRIDQKINWVKVDNLHITLKFIGNIETYNLTNIDQSLNNIKQQLIKEKYYLKFIDLMPAVNPKIIYLKIDNDNLPKIMALIDKYLNNSSMHDKNYLPHVTLGRIKDKINKTNINILKKYPVNISETFECFILYKSTLTPQGPIYQPLKIYKL